ERGVAIRFRPGDFVDSAWPTPMLGPQGQKFGGGGAGWVEYALPAPEDLDGAAVAGMRLLFEGAARTASSRIGWKRPWQPVDQHYPQTETRKLPSTLTVTVNGTPL